MYLFSLLSERMAKDDGFVLVGAGLPRTGTLSTRVALQRLLKGNIYHGFQLVMQPEHHPTWWRAMEEGASSEEFKNILKDFRGGVDYPVARFYQEIMAAYPEAKVLLNVRDPSKWYVSVRDSILRLSKTTETFPVSWFYRLMGVTKTNNIGMALCFNPPPWSSSGLGMLGAVEAGEEKAVCFYNDHVAEVKRHVPADRLLVWEVKQGWEPLCKFLDVPVPDEPFPRINDSARIEHERKIVLAMSWIGVVGVPSAMALIAYRYRFKQPRPYMLMAGGYMVVAGALRAALQYRIHSIQNQ